MSKQKRLLELEKDFIRDIKVNRLIEGVEELMKKGVKVLVDKDKKPVDVISEKKLSEQEYRNALTFAGELINKLNDANDSQSAPEVEE